MSATSISVYDPIFLALTVVSNTSAKVTFSADCVVRWERETTPGVWTLCSFTPSESMEEPPYRSIDTIAAKGKKIIALHPVITPIVRTPGRYRTLIWRLEVGGKVHGVAPVTVEVVAHAANQAALATTGDYALLLRAVRQVEQASVPDFPPAFLQWLNTIHANPQISAAVRQITAYFLAHFEFEARDYQNCITLANDAEAYAGTHISTGGLHGAALVSSTRRR